MELHRIPVLNMWAQFVPDADSEILGAGEFAFHEVHVQVQVAVVDAFYDDVFDEVAKGLGIVDEAGLRVWFTLDGDMQLIIVAMPVLIGTLAKNILVLILAPAGIVQAVCGIKILYARQIDHYTNLKGQN